LKYDRIDLMGGSYGTRAALEYLRRHPDHVRTVIVEGVAPPGYKLPLPFAKTIQDSIERVFAECAAEERCHGAYPNLRDEFLTALRNLEKAPAKYTLGPPVVNRPLVEQMSRDMFLDFMRLVLYVPELVSALPQLIHLAAANNYAAFGATVYPIRKDLDRRIARGMLLSVVCGEDVPFISDAEVERETKGTWMGDFRVRAHRDACGVWPRAEVPKEFHDPIRSGKPVLLISGEMDPATPPSFAAGEAKFLPNSRHVVIREGTHLTASPCIDKLVAQFVDRGSMDGLDTGCVGAIKHPPFIVYGK
jgi:pimeloyl-ACP methyl ester carboxylesterase